MEKLNHYTEEMELRIAMRDCNSLGPVRMSFPRNELLPGRNDQRQNPRHGISHRCILKNKTFGYEAIQFHTRKPQQIYTLTGVPISAMRSRMY